MRQWRACCKMGVMEILNATKLKAAAGRTTPGTFSCLECDGGQYVRCARPTCFACGAEAPTGVRYVMRELEKNRPAA